MGGLSAESNESVKQRKASRERERVNEKEDQSEGLTLEIRQPVRGSMLKRAAQSTHCTQSVHWNRI